MHVPREFLAAIADQVGGLVWAEPVNDDDEHDDGPAGMPVPVREARPEASPPAAGKIWHLRTQVPDLCAKHLSTVNSVSGHGLGRTSRSVQQLSTGTS